MPDIIQQIRDTYSTDKAAALNMLPELFQQYDDGKIVELPCKVGDTVYLNHPYWGDLCKGFVYQITDTTYWDCCISAKSALVGKEFSATQSFSDFGKTVFLTRESAEAALKERES